jgi:hypothetical protein
MVSLICSQKAVSSQDMILSGYDVVSNRSIHFGATNYTELHVIQLLSPCNVYYLYYGSQALFSGQTTVGPDLAQRDGWSLEVRKKDWMSRLGAGLSTWGRQDRTQPWMQKSERAPRETAPLQV